jgi:ATP-dependent helicase/nuclease subunit B
MFVGPAPRWFTIPAHRPFLPDLAAGLSERLGPAGPEALADAVVLLPTRRAASALAAAFVAAAGGRAVLLPQIRAIGDLDEGEPPFEPGPLALDLPAAIEPRRRRFELARLVHDHAHLLQRELDAGGALELADALGAFLDSCQLEEVEVGDQVDGLVEGELARHWQVSADFLAIAVRAWPERLAQIGLVDSAERRVRLLRVLAEQWRAHPPAGPLIAAGSTGTAPAVANLLAVVAQAPQGAVVLPGLDLDLAEDAWVQVDEQHPQGAMKRLLDRARVARDAVAVWSAAEPALDAARGRARRRLVNEALRPAEATADWLEQIDALRREGDDVLTQGFAGLSLVTARTEEQAAAAAALLLRESLERPETTAALVTPDRDLARRVAARLTRWGVAVDSSAGAPLSAFPVGVLIALTARLAADPADPVVLLGVLKHPLVRLGMPWDGRKDAVRAFEKRVLRGARPRNWAALERRATPGSLERRKGETAERFAEREAAEAAGAALAGKVLEAIGPILQALTATFAEGPITGPVAARAHAACLEALTRDERGRLGDLWAGPEGEAAATLFAGLISESGGLPPVNASGWAALTDRLLRDETIRTGGASHARVRILGAIEARLVRADRLILAGLEEGIWPRAAPTDPFLSRPMRQRLGLPPPERRIGLSAHDFAQAACAPEVVLLHTERRGGAPTVQSRWLWRLQTLARGAGTTLPADARPILWAEQLDAPDRFAPAKRPEPCPPAEDRPTGLSVTRVEQWVRNPYEIYAREILNLRRLDPPDAPLEAAARGTAVHAALERFALAHDGIPAPEREQAFEQMLNEALAEAGLSDQSQAREALLARNAAPWVIEFERRRRADGRTLLVEQRGEWTLDIDGQPFTLTAKSDRIEIVAGAAHVLDFKTGAPPSKKQVETDFAPQLTLTAAILQAGGFQSVGRVTPGELTYVRFTGRRTPGEEKVVVEAFEAQQAADRAVEGLAKRVRRFRDPSTPYPPWTAPQWRKHAGDYDHVARVWEWMVLGDEET